MKKINNFILSAGMLVAVSAGMIACEKTQTTSDGIEYTYIKEGSEKPKNGEFVVYHFTAKKSNDSTFISSYDQPTPAYLQYNDSTEKQSGIDEIFLGLKSGDSIVINSTAEKVFGAQGLPPFLTNEEEVTISIGVVDVLEEQVFQDYFNDLAEAHQKKQSEKAVVQLQEDVKILEGYIAENNLEATKTESGLFYVIEEEGNGPEVEQGDTVSVNYTGYVLDGTVFDTSLESVAKESNTFMEGRPYEPIEIQVGMGRVIPGWDEGLQYLKEGSKAKLLIPSTLAYGDQDASEVIKANSVLIFDVEVTDVQK
ncbi:MAG: FKBP-type peptidyl-prolyl cis-trans isomerase [Anditalea sp.]